MLPAQGIYIEGEMSLHERACMQSAWPHHCVYIAVTRQQVCNAEECQVSDITPRTSFTRIHTPIMKVKMSLHERASSLHGHTIVSI